MMKFNLNNTIRTTFFVLAVLALRSPAEAALSVENMTWKGKLTFNTSPKESSRSVQVQTTKIVCGKGDRDPFAASFSQIGFGKLGLVGKVRLVNTDDGWQTGKLEKTLLPRAMRREMRKAGVDFADFWAYTEEAGHEPTDESPLTFNVGAQGVESHGKGILPIRSHTNRLRAGAGWIALPNLDNPLAKTRHPYAVGVFPGGKVMALLTQGTGAATKTYILQGRVQGWTRYYVVGALPLYDSHASVATETQVQLDGLLPSGDGTLPGFGVVNALDDGKSGQTSFWGAYDLSPCE